MSNSELSFFRMRIDEYIETKFLDIENRLRDSI